jgi:hypothetical protein
VVVIRNQARYDEEKVTPEKSHFIHGVEARDGSLKHINSLGKAFALLPLE